jgi:hypothetical protein
MKKASRPGRFLAPWRLVRRDSFHAMGLASAATSNFVGFAPVRRPFVVADDANGELHFMPE